MADKYGTRSEKFNFRGFAGNAASAIASNITSTISMYMPYSSTAVDSIATTARDAVDFIRENRPDKTNRNRDQVMRNVLRNAKNVMDTAADEAFHGELGFEAAREQLGDYLDTNVKSEWDFDDLDDEDFSDDGGSEEKFTAADFAEGIYASASATINATEVSTRNTIKHIYKSSNAATNRLIATNLANTAKISEQFSVTNAKLDALNGNLMNLVQFNNTAMNKFIDNANKHMAKQESFMNEMLNITRKMSGTEEKKRRNTNDTDWYSQGFDTNKFLKRVFDTGPGGYLATGIAMTTQALFGKTPKMLEDYTMGVQSFGELVKQINPLGMVMNRVLNQLEGLKVLDNDFQELLMNVVDKARNGKIIQKTGDGGFLDDLRGAISDWLRGIAASDVQPVGRKKAGYDAVPWSEMDSNNLGNVIPDYLSSIEMLMDEANRRSVENTKNIITAINDLHEDVVNYRGGGTRGRSGSGSGSRRRRARTNSFGPNGPQFEGYGMDDNGKYGMLPRDMDNRRIYDHAAGKMQNLGKIKQENARRLINDANTGFEGFDEMMADVIKGADLSKEQRELLRDYEYMIKVKMRDDEYDVNSDLAMHQLDEAFETIDNDEIRRKFEDARDEIQSKFLAGVEASRKSIVKRLENLNKQGYYMGDLIYAFGNENMFGDAYLGIKDDDYKNRTATEKYGKFGTMVMGDDKRTFGGFSSGEDLINALVSAGMTELSLDHRMSEQQKERARQKLYDAAKKAKEGDLQVADTFEGASNNPLNRAIGAIVRTVHAKKNSMLGFLNGKRSGDNVRDIFDELIDAFRDNYDTMGKEIEQNKYMRRYNDNGKFLTEGVKTDDGKVISREEYEGGDYESGVQQYATGAVNIDKDKIVKVHKGELILDPALSDKVRDNLMKYLNTGIMDEARMKRDVEASGKNYEDFKTQLRKAIGPNNKRKISIVKIAAQDITDITEDPESFGSWFMQRMTEISDNLKAIGHNNIEMMREDARKAQDDWRKGINHSLFGEKGEDGLFRNGALSTAVNKVKDRFGYARWKLTGKGYDGFMRNSDGSYRYDEDGKLIKETYDDYAVATKENYVKEYSDRYNAYVEKAKNDNPNASPMKFKEWAESLEGTDQAIVSYDKYVEKHQDDSVQNQLIGFLRRQLANATDILNLDEGAEEAAENAVDFIGKNAPNMLAGGVAGLLANAILGFSIGPIMGIAGSIAASSDSFKDYMLGERMRDGTRNNNGLISQDFQKMFKEHTGKFIGAGVIGALGMKTLGKTALGGLAGTLAQGITGAVGMIPGVGGILGTLMNGITGITFGPLGGAMLGIAGAAVTQTETMQKLLFGEKNDQGERQGGLVGKLKQATMKFIDPIQEYLFGPEGQLLDEDGKPMYDKNGKPKMKRKGGLVGRLRNTIDLHFITPLKHAGKYMKDYIKLWFESEIKFNVQRIMEPLAIKIADITSNIKLGISTVAGKIADGIAAAFKPVTTALTKVGDALVQLTLGSAKAIVKLGLGSVSAPFKILAAALNIGNSRKTFKMKTNLLLNDFAYGMENVKQLMTDLADIWAPNRQRRAGSGKSLKDKIMEIGGIDLGARGRLNRLNKRDALLSGINARARANGNTLQEEMSSAEYRKYKRLNSAKSNISYIAMTIRDGVVNAFETVVPKVKNWFSTIGDRLVKKLSESKFGQKILSFGKFIGEGAKNISSRIAGHIGGNLRGFAEGAKNDAKQFGSFFGNLGIQSSERYKSVKGAFDRFGNKIQRTGEAFTRAGRRARELRGIFNIDDPNNEYLKQYQKDRMGIIDTSATEEGLSKLEKLGVMNDEQKKQYAALKKQLSSQQAFQKRIDNAKMKAGSILGGRNVNEATPAQRKKIKKLLKGYGMDEQIDQMSDQSLSDFIYRDKFQNEEEKLKRKAIERQASLPETIAEGLNLTIDKGGKFGQFFDDVHRIAENTDSLSDVRKAKEAAKAKESAETSIAQVLGGASSDEAEENTDDETTTAEGEDGEKKKKGGLFGKLAGGAKNLFGKITGGSGLLSKLASFGGIGGKIGGALGNVTGAIGGAASGIAGVFSKLVPLLGPIGVVLGVGLAWPILSKIDFAGLIGKLTDGATKVIDGVVNIGGKIMTDVIPDILTRVSENLPSILETATTTVTTFATDHLPGLLDKVCEAIPSILNSALTGVVNILTKTLPVLLQKLAESIPTIAGSLIKGATELIFKALPKMISSLADQLPAIIGALIRAGFKSMISFPKLIGSIVIGLIDGLKRAFDKGYTSNYDEFDTYSDDEVESALNNSYMPDGVTVEDIKKEYDGDPKDLEGFGSGDIYFGHYTQTDPRWRNMGYGRFRSGRRSSIGMGGCGPTAFANAVNAVRGRNVTNPKAVANYASRHGYNVQGGTSASLFTKGASSFGVKSKAIGTNSNSIANSVRHGNSVVVSGKGGSAYTKAGHIMSVRGVDGYGNAIVDDPMRRKSRRIPMNKLTRGMTHAWSIGYGDGDAIEHNGNGFGVNRDDTSIKANPFQNTVNTEITNEVKQRSDAKEATTYSNMQDFVLSRSDTGDNFITSPNTTDGPKPFSAVKLPDSITSKFHVSEKYKPSPLIASGVPVFVKDGDVWKKTDKQISMGDPYSAYLFGLNNKVMNGQGCVVTSLSSALATAFAGGRDSSGYPTFSRLSTYNVPIGTSMMYKMGYPDWFAHSIMGPYFMQKSVGTDPSSYVGDWNSKTLSTYADTLAGIYNSSAIMKEYIRYLFDGADMTNPTIKNAYDKYMKYFSMSKDDKTDYEKRKDRDLRLTHPLTYDFWNSDDGKTLQAYQEIAKFALPGGNIELETNHYERQCYGLLDPLKRNTMPVKISDIVNQKNRSTILASLLENNWPVVIHRNPNSKFSDNALSAILFGRSGSSPYPDELSSGITGRTEHAVLLHGIGGYLDTESRKDEAYVMIHDSGSAQLPNAGGGRIRFIKERDLIDALGSNGDGGFKNDLNHIYAFSPSGVDLNNSSKLVEFMNNHPNAAASYAVNPEDRISYERTNAKDDSAHSSGSWGTDSAAEGSVDVDSWLGYIAEVTKRLSKIGIAAITALLTGKKGIDPIYRSGRAATDSGSIADSEAYTGVDTRTMLETYGLSGLDDAIGTTARMSQSYIDTLELATSSGEVSSYLMDAYQFMANNDLPEPGSDNPNCLNANIVEVAMRIITCDDYISKIRAYKNASAGGENPFGSCPLSGIKYFMLAKACEKRNLELIDAAIADEYNIMADASINYLAREGQAKARSRVKLNNILKNLLRSVISEHKNDKYTNLSGGSLSQDVLYDAENWLMDVITASETGVTDVNDPSQWAKAYFSPTKLGGEKYQTLGRAGFYGENMANLFRDLAKTSSLSKTLQDQSASIADGIINNTVSVNDVSSFLLNNPEVQDPMRRLQDAAMRKFVEDTYMTKAYQSFSQYGLTDPRALLLGAEFGGIAPACIPDFYSATSGNDIDTVRSNIFSRITRFTNYGSYGNGWRNRVNGVVNMLRTKDGYNNHNGQKLPLPQSIINAIPEDQITSDDSIGYGNLRDSMRNAPTSDIYTKDDVYMGDPNHPMCVTMDDSGTTSRLDEIISILREAVFGKDIPKAGPQETKSTGYGKPTVTRTNDTSKTITREVPTTPQGSDRLRAVHERLARRARAH